MELPPLFQRELRVALDKYGARGVRFRAALTAVLIASGFGILGPYFGNRNPGERVFGLLLLVACSSALLETLRLSVDLLSTERRNNTLELLILAGLSVPEVFASKLAGSLLTQLWNVLALLPGFAVCFVLGGVPLRAFIAVIILIPNLMFLALALSLASSVLCRREESSIVLASIVGGVLGLTTPAIYYGGQLVSGAVSRDWLLLSPLYGILILWHPFVTASVREFWINSQVTFLYSAVLMALAVWVLQKTWCERSIDVSALGLKLPLSGRFAGLFRRVSNLQQGLLDRNPYAWLSLRETATLRLAWIVTGLLTGAWLTFFTLWPRSGAATFHLALTALVIDAVVGLLALFGTATRLANDRRSGALELLLTTPLSVREIVDGQVEALRDGYGPLRLYLVVLHLALICAGLWVRDWDAIALTTYFEVWLVIGCIVMLSVRSKVLPQIMWVALNSGRPLLTMTKVVCPPTLPLCFVFFFYSLRHTSWPTSFPSGELPELWFISIGLGATVLMLLLWRGDSESTQKLVREFRAVAQEPVPEASDPRLRTWNTAERFPTPVRPFLLVNPRDL